MGSDTERDSGGFRVDEYWRRRALALMGALGAVGLLAWGCAGGEGERKEPVSNAAAEADASASEVPPAPSVMPTVTVTATPKITPAPVEPETAPGKAPAEEGDACGKGDVVIAMAATRDAYAGAARPQFRLTAVSTGEQPCRFDAGAGALDVRITSGSDRVWSSARCDRAGGTSMRQLRRGIPYVTTITWDRRRGGGDCKGARPAARPGTYVATLKAAGAKPERQVFRLR